MNVAEQLVKSSTRLQEKNAILIVWHREQKLQANCSITLQMFLCLQVYMSRLNVFFQTPPTPMIKVCI